MVERKPTDRFPVNEVYHPPGFIPSCMYVVSLHPKVNCGGKTAYIFWLRGERAKAAACAEHAAIVRTWPDLERMISA